jgi:excisionase family DNA binding protein
MENLLTAQQVEDLLKVNRITIYRMLQDGRLNGVKIGQQWRFPANQFDKLLTGLSLKTDPSSIDAGKKAGFPTHCVQTIQDLFADVGQVSTITLESIGNPFTQISHPSAYWWLIYQNPAGKTICEESWKEIALDAHAEGWFTCRLGCVYLKLPIHDEEEVIGFALVGQFASNEARSMVDVSIHDIAQICTLDRANLLEKYRQLPSLNETMRTQVQGWGAQFVRAVESILRERSGFINRLQRIVEIGTV